MLFDAFDDVNYLAVAVAALAYFALAAIWYAPPILGRTWQRAVGLSEEQLGPNPMIFVATFVAYLIGALALALIARSAGADSVADGIVLGLVVGVGIVATGIWIGGAYEQRPTTLSLINIGNGLLGYVLMAIIVTVWD